MSEYESEMLNEIRKIVGLLELLAEEKIAQRDAKQRAALREVAGGNRAKQRAIILINEGTRAQKAIAAEAAIDASDLSKLVSRLHDAKLITDKKLPKLVISVPPNFFEADAKAK